MKNHLPSALLTAIAAVFIGALSVGVAEEAPTLATRLQELKEKFDSETPAEIKAIFEKDIAAVIKSGVTEKAIRVGDKAPAFTLRNAVDKEVSLSDLLKKGPVVLTFYRGGWCPYCNEALRAYQDALAEITKAGGQLVALTPELPDMSLSTKEKNELEYEILSDGGQTVARIYGVVFQVSPEVAAILEEVVDLKKYNGPDAEIDALPLAATYIIDSSGTVRWAFLDADYRKRAEPAEIVAALKELAAAAGKNRPSKPPGGGSAQFKVEKTPLSEENRPAGSPPLPYTEAPAI